MGLQNAVGLNHDGSFAPNLAIDQQQVAELLMRVPLPNGGLRTSSGPATAIPQPYPGSAGALDCACVTIEGARALIRSSAAGLISEHVMLGPSPSL